MSITKRNKQRKLQQNQKILTNFIPHIFKHIFFMQLQQLIKKAAFIILAIMLVASTATAQDILKQNFS